MCTRRFVYVLAVAEAASGFVAVDPDSGVVTQMLFQNNISFLLDPLDSTTTADGVTCLVSNEGKRYKSATVTPPYSVLTRQTSAEPGSSSVGDTYLIPTAATGTDWSGKDGQIGIYTAAGWRFATSPIGRFLYVKDETAFYHRNAAGTWQAGVGSVVLSAGSVTLPNVLGANASFVIKVENQTTNTPPGSPVTPTAYIIGSSPTGAWSGHAGSLAICLVAGAFTIIMPVNGDVVYDKAQNNAFTFNGTAWVSSAGSWVGRVALQTTSGSTTAPSGSTPYTYSSGTAPTTSIRRLIDTATLAYTAKRSGSTMRFHYSGDVTLTAGSLGPSNIANVVVALFRDSVANAIDWQLVPVASVWAAFGGGSSSIVTHLDHWFEVASPDTSAHTYTVAITCMIGSTNQGVDPSALTRRTIEIEEST